MYYIWSPVIDTPLAFHAISDALANSSFDVSTKNAIATLISTLLTTSPHAPITALDNDDNERFLSSQEQTGFETLLASESVSWPGRIDLVRPAGDIRSGGVKLWLHCPELDTGSNVLERENNSASETTDTASTLQQHGFRPHTDYAACLCPLRPIPSIPHPHTSSLLQQSQALNLLNLSFQTRFLRAIQLGGVHILFGWEQKESFRKITSSQSFLKSYETKTLPVNVNGTWVTMTFLRPIQFDHHHPGPFTNVFFDVPNPSALVHFGDSHWQRVRYDFAVQVSLALTAPYRRAVTAELERQKGEEDMTRLDSLMERLGIDAW